MQTLKTIAIQFWFLIVGYLLMWIWSLSVGLFFFVPLSIVLMWYVGRSVSKHLRQWIRKYEGVTEGT